MFPLSTVVWPSLLRDTSGSFALSEGGTLRLNNRNQFDKMSFLFGGKDDKKKPKEIAREQQREVRKSERTVERELVAMQRQEKQLIADIKKAAKVRA